jgi:hypothetical protein
MGDRGEDQMKDNITSRDIGLVCDVHWFLYGFVQATKIFKADCPIDDDHLKAMDKSIGILKELRDKD